MAQKHFNEFSYKTVRKSSNFLHSVWQPSQKLDIEANIYHDYYKIGNYNYVNDFWNNCWKKTSELSHEQVVCIHEDNKEKAYENNTSYFKSRVYGIDKNNFDSSFSSDSIISIPSSEMEVTDEFLDSLHIPKGKRGERITLMKKQSELFSRFLSLHIGTERIVKLRQLLLNKFVNIADTLSFEIIGSRSEGLDMIGSDTDILIVTNLTAHESGEHLNNSISTVEYDSLMDGIHPGYVILEDIASSNEMHTCLDESKKIINQFFKSKPHGPALMQSVLGADYDYVISIKSESWPKIAMEWINRNRQYGWPPQEMIYSIVQKGCHIVPVGSSRNHAEDKDWRLSFCTAEKQLIETFSHTQILVYGVLKLVLKEIINKRNTAEILCSYFLKTVMFWIVEETSSSYWIPQNLLLCLRLCIRRLIQFVIEENCPNYFVICNNMFQERFNTLDKETLLQILCDIASTGLQWVLKIKTLERFPYFMTRQKLNENVLENTVYKREQLDMFKLLVEIVLRCRQTTCSMMSKVIPTNKSFLSTVFKVPIVRQKTISMLCHFIDTEKTNLGNKKRYALYKFQLQLLTTESIDNLISGKILLASWLYQQGKYTESLQVTDAGLKNLDLCMFHNRERIMRNDLFDKVFSSTRDFTEILYLSSSDYMFPIRSHLVPREIQETIGLKQTNIFFQYRFPMIDYCPRSYSYLLRSFCYFKLGDAQRCEHEYNEMKLVCDTYCGSLKTMHQTSNFILKLICNKVRHNINFDFSNKFEAARVLIQHSNEFDVTLSEIENFLRNASELIIHSGLSSEVIDDFISDGTPTER